MARLPSRADLSGPASFRSGKVIASYDTSALGRGIEKLGGDISAFGREKEAQNNAVDLARAEAIKTEGFLGVQNEFANDPDYATYGKRAPEKTGGVIQSAAGVIRDPKMRERWALGARADAARVNDGILDHGVATGRAAEVIAFDNALETNRRIYVDPTSSDDVKAKAKADIEGAIQMGQHTGLLDPVDAENRREAYIRKATVSGLMLKAEQDPGAILGTNTVRPTGPVGEIIVGKANQYGVPPAIALGIAQIESGLNPNAKAGTSSAGGLFQFIDGTAAQYGLSNKFDASANADAGARFTRDNMNRLRKTLGREPTPGEVYLAHFSGVGAAEDLGQAHANTPTTEIFSAAAINANRSILEGKTAGQVRAWADRKMAAAMQKAGGGTYQVANGDQQAAAPEWSKDVSPEDRMRIMQAAQTRQNQINVETRGAIDTVVQNAPAAIQNTGTYSGQLPSQQQFVDAYGPQDGQERYDKFQASVDVSQQAYDFRTMSSADIEQAVKDATPTSSGNDAALQASKYSVLQDAAATTLKARNADPSAYTQAVFPSVAQAWQQAQESGDYQSAMAQTAAAQRQLGIANMQLLPAAVADQRVTTFKDENLPEQERIGAIAGMVFSTNDPEQRLAVFDQLVKAGLPDITAGAIRAAARKDTGAAQRLFEAAMVDVSKLPGKNPDTAKPAAIDEAIQSQLMDVNQIGDVYYGLSDGSAENMVAAQRDSKLMTNAVTLRVRKGENLDAAVSSVAKDLFGDVKPVSGANVSILIPSDQDERVVTTGLDAMQPKIRQVLEQTLALPSPEPSGAVQGQVEKGNIDLAARPVVKNADGSISTVRSMSFNEDGVEILVPTVSPDGKILSDQAAIDLYRKTGQNLGKFQTPEAATAYAESLHKAQADYYGTTGDQRTIMGATRANEINRLMLDGYWRNAGNGFAFLDPKTGLAVAGPDGNPLIFSEKEVLAAGGTAKANAGSVGQTLISPTNNYDARTPEPGAGPSLDENGNPVVLGQ